MNSKVAKFGVDILNKRLSNLKSIKVITDTEDYLNVDQVFPIHAEQEFFLDELNLGKVKDANVLEIGIGSGVLSIGVLKQGARAVTALEINARAKIFAGFNAMINGVEGKLSIIDGDVNDIFSPVEGKNTTTSFQIRHLNRHQLMGLIFTIQKPDYSVWIS